MRGIPSAKQYLELANPKRRELFIHLLRALLRECSYLPDPEASRYWHSHVISRYSDCHPGQYLKLIPSEARQTSLLGEGKDTLKTLKRANAGGRKALGRLLAHTYGRTGKRRHELIKRLREPDIPGDHKAVLQAAIAYRESLDKLPTLTSKLKAVAQAQKLQNNLILSRPPIRAMQVQIPSHNIWGRPMPAKRVPNIARRWYAQILDRILPPLPETDWNRLRELALGLKSWQGPILRRRALVSHNEPIFGGSDELFTRKCGDRPRELSGRAMKRLWASVFVQCSVLRWNHTRQKWDVEWGRLSRPNETISVKQESRFSSEFFEGVNEQGRAQRRT
ncbi:hypothetical protein MMC20_001767 [Loxospora ochrophaea]|nr:hypothetical protein [Loxospora ochrophaea]